MTDLIDSYPQRKSPRLTDYDYRTPGAYFITICTHGRKCILSDIPTPSAGEGLAPPAASVSLTETGRIVEQHLLDIPVRFPSVTLDHYVLMPNHVHILLTLSGSNVEEAGGASPSPTTISQVIGTFKSLATRAVHDWILTQENIPGQISDAGKPDPLFQRSFHDHIVRNENEYRLIAEYIVNNQIRWVDDCFLSAT